MGELRGLALELVNQSRQAEGLEPLVPGDMLDEAAQAHAEDMLAEDYYAHVSPDGRGPRDRFLAAGGSEWVLVAENIARCSGCPAPPGRDRVRAFHDGWMNSPEHRANILTPGLQRFGFGIVAGGGLVYAVQTFAGPGASDEGGGAVLPDSMAATRAALDRLNAARQEAGAPPLEADQALIDAATSLLPDDLTGFRLQDLGGIRSALPAEARRDWRRLALAAGACGGCGTRPVETDVADFTEDWLSPDGANRDRLLDPGMTSAGFVLRADGNGRKVALLIVGEAF